jgi:hypothetical protein
VAQELAHNLVESDPHRFVAMREEWNLPRRAYSAIVNEVYPRAARFPVTKSFPPPFLRFPSRELRRNGCVQQPCLAAGRMLI